MTNLSHTASFHSNERIAPSNRGIKHLATVLNLDDGAFIVGGHPLNLWAERYADARELAQYGPYTSKDLDYFGHRDAAEKLAKILGSRLLIPFSDNATPQCAVVVAEIGGEEIRIDFLKYVKGVRVKALEASEVELILPAHTSAGPAELALPVMHPLHCLQGRIANVVELGREDDVAARQLAAAPVIVREYVSEMLEVGEHAEATRTLQRLFEHLRSDINGRLAHRHAGRDPAEIIDHFAHDKRLDHRYRGQNFRLCSACYARSGASSRACRRGRTAAALRPRASAHTVDRLLPAASHCPAGSKRAR